MKQEKDRSDEDRAGERLDRAVYDYRTKTIDYTKMRPTDLKTCPRSKIPEPNDSKEEERMQVIRASVMEAAQEYILKETIKGKPKKLNAGKDVMKGIREIKKLVERKEAIVTITDKSGRLTIDTPENYNEAMKVHLKDDPIISHKEKDMLERQCSVTAGHMIKVFNISRDEDQSRTKQAMTSSHTPAPPSTS